MIYRNLMVLLKTKRLSNKLTKEDGICTLELIFNNPKDLSSFIKAFQKQKTTLNKYITSPEPSIDYPKFIIKFLKSMKYKNLNQFNMYLPQQFYYMQPQMQQMGQPMPMMNQAYQQPNPMMLGMTNNKPIYRGPQNLSFMAFRNINDVINRKDEFSKLAKQNRQEILKAILIGKLKMSKNSEL